MIFCNLHQFDLEVQVTVKGNHFYNSRPSCCCCLSLLLTHACKRNWLLQSLSDSFGFSRNKQFAVGGGNGAKLVSIAKKYAQMTRFEMAAVYGLKRNTICSKAVHGNAQTQNRDHAHTKILYLRHV